MRTQPDDRELITRDEVQRTCPDILITNYSMLEYMLMRPIERSIFKQTTEWLESNPGNRLILVLDEAHMYRGTGGAEVALLIRRLMARLQISRDRLQCILTSASLGEGAEAEAAVLDFAGKLTGLTSESNRRFKLIKGVQESVNHAQPGTFQEAEILAKFNLDDFQKGIVEHHPGRTALLPLVSDLSWGTLPSDWDDIPDFLYRKMKNWGPAELMVESLSGHAVQVDELSSTLFPRVPEMISHPATEALIALGTFAQNKHDGRVFLPTRLHLFYRGLPALYACTDVACTDRLGTEETQSILGCLHTTPRLRCTCHSKSRVYELLTHRDCGAAFIKGYTRATADSFLLHEPVGDVGIQDSSERFYDVQLLVDGEPHVDALQDCNLLWLDAKTGRLAREEPRDKRGFLRVYAPVPKTGNGEDRVFGRCPICLRTWRGRSKIMDLSTKGEAPFANLVKEQLFLQSPKITETSKYPNGGRKVLLFSDGRQKAARLARDIPREVEWDSFRQAISLAVRKYHQVTDRDPRINSSLYGALIAVASEFNTIFFDGPDRKELLKAVKEFRDELDGSLEVAIEENWDFTPPQSYYRLLLRQLCSPEFSLRAATLGYVRPASIERLIQELRRINESLSRDDVEQISVSFVQEVLSDYAFETESLISASVRRDAAGHPQNSWASDGKLPNAVRNILIQSFGLRYDDVEKIEGVLRRKLCHSLGDAYVLKGNEVSLTIRPDETWYQCNACTYLSPVHLAGHCVNCGSREVQPLIPESSEYIRARKGFLREPVMLALSGLKSPKNITAEEHTAQLSQRDTGNLFATTEKYELRFQDILIEDDEGAVDVLSSTTTMEVGIDIGSLVAVGLRNVPPQRENYQQRAGRAGRRGSSVSTVITYAQGGPHDSYYFHHPAWIVSGQPRLPMIKTDNAKIAQRHVNAYLMQTFFHHRIDEGTVEDLNYNQGILSVLGTASDFFQNTNGNLTFEEFSQWVRVLILESYSPIMENIVRWLPTDISSDMYSWVKATAKELLDQLKAVRDMVKIPLEKSSGVPLDTNDEDTVETGYDFGDSRDELLSFLFDQGLLPSYAFPIDLCSFVIEGKESRLGGFKVVVKERPQQSIDKSLSEYAPGRLIVVDKITYRSGGITANSSLPTDPDRALPLFESKRNLRPYVSCPRCTFVQDLIADPQNLENCPVCQGPLEKGEMLIPEVFHPERGESLNLNDTEQEYTYATSAQFPVPVSVDDLQEWTNVGENIRVTYARNKRLVMVNKGDSETNEGFSICEKCGAASVFDSHKFQQREHVRPYKVEPKSGVYARERCDGLFRQVFLGHQFQTDLLVLRINLQSPLVRRLDANVSANVLHDALRTISEVLILATSECLDLDPSEFHAGYRLVRPQSGDAIRGDIYLFDTLSGGAGYGEQAGKVVDVILSKSLERLENCPAHCDTSCTECLRHYQNQYWHSNLDRRLGAALLRYCLFGTVPEFSPTEEQSDMLIALARLLQLDGMKCTMKFDVNGVFSPLVVSDGTTRLAVGVVPSLLEENEGVVTHPMMNVEAGNLKRVVFSQYLLVRNLPLVYHRVKLMFEEWR